MAELQPRQCTGSLNIRGEGAAIDADGGRDRGQHPAEHLRTPPISPTAGPGSVFAVAGSGSRRGRETGGAVGGCLRLGSDRRRASPPSCRVLRWFASSLSSYGSSSCFFFALFGAGAGTSPLGAVIGARGAPTGGEVSGEEALGDGAGGELTSADELTGAGDFEASNTAPIAVTSRQKTGAKGITDDETARGEMLLAGIE